jgi:predicted MFS family arabinose efflux permease
MAPREPERLTSVVSGLRVVAALSLGPVVAISFARFAYALLLPAMRADLGLDYAHAGALNTANALGYLAGALLCVRYGSRLGNRRLFGAGLAMTVVALLSAGLTDDYVAQLCSRAVAGVGGAWVYICGATLASNAFPGRSDRASLAIGVYFAGAGAGIAISGVGVPALLAVAGDDAWREAWLAIGSVSVLFAMVAVRAARTVEEPATSPQARRWPMRALGPALGSYLLFGVGYIAYMTFVVAWMTSRGAPALEVALTWTTLGVATMLAPLAWRYPRARWQPARTLAATGAVISAGAAIPLVSTSLGAMLLSALLFGGAMFTVPTAVTDLVKASLPRSAWGSALAVFTAVFAAGQAVGPLLTGWLADRVHTLHGGLAVSAVILFAGGLAALGQRERSAAHARAVLRAGD